MKYYILSIFFTFFIFSNAQSILNSRSPETFRINDSINIVKTLDGTNQSGDKPINYIDVSEKDIAWSKLVWEIIDLNEEANKVFKVDTNFSFTGRKSLYKSLLRGMELSKINEVYEDDQFRVKLDHNKLLQKNKVRVLSEDGKKWQNANPGGLIPDSYYDEYEIDNEQVSRFKILGMWYIDKRIGQLKYRLLGICPMGPDINVLAETGEKDYVDLFWVWYANARETLHLFKAFNDDNSSSKVSYDDMLLGRKFSSLIYKIENKEDNTLSRIYKEDKDSQIEAALRFKEELIKIEGRLWVN
ncbi:MAG: gliding motility protein GldN [Solirubrobacteraceae bacterium]